MSIRDEVSRKVEMHSYDQMTGGRSYYADCPECGKNCRVSSDDYKSVCSHFGYINKFTRPGTMAFNVSPSTAARLDAAAQVAARKVGAK